jgi:hypothetical protein
MITSADNSEESDNGEDSGVESEVEDVVIDRPFDPEKIKIRTINIVVEQIISRIQHSEIDLSPEFQRLRGVWDLKRKSRLIESLLLRIPIPVFYVAEDASETWSVVDGLQRMSTLYDFMVGEFALSDLEYLKHFERNHFKDLPRPMQRRISETQLVVNVIERGTPEEVMFNIFSRINTGGMKLNGQEIRHALHKGPVRTYLQELAELPQFILATDNSIRPTRMSDRECVLRFLAFYIYPWERYSSNDLDGFLGRAMNELNAMTSENRAQLKDVFIKAMVAAARIFGDDAFRKRYKPNVGRNPVSKALFEAWGVALARRTPEEIEKLVTLRWEVQHAFIRLMSSNREFDVAISYSTGVPQRVSKRFGEIESLITETLHASKAQTQEL